MAVLVGELEGFLQNACAGRFLSEPSVDTSRYLVGGQQMGEAFGTGGQLGVAVAGESAQAGGEPEGGAAEIEVEGGQFAGAPQGCEPLVAGDAGLFKLLALLDALRMGRARERKLAEEKIRQLNVELELRVVERTAELEAANKELESFSYSVSHDLRAPLRAVNGFARIVLDEFGPQLNGEGRRYLERICNGGQQMGVLIDDLLAFSRLSRQSMNRQEVDSAKLVKAVLVELAPQWEGRQVEIGVEKLPPCQGDPALLKQVWVNLISNAIKYSRGREPAVIEIGCNRKDEENIHFIKDNGTGFDMQYAGKLFGVFQRLHRADEFEGTGVGLAIVQRIIHRHGGRIWAEAELGKGATFYFTLEGKNKL